MFSLLGKKRRAAMQLKAPISGKVITLEDVKDGVFSERVLGDGLAIIPEGQIIAAPCDGIVSLLMEDSRHAVGMTLNNGVEILIHEGIDTVSMEGEGFEYFVSQGQKVKCGDRLMKFDQELIQAKGYSSVCVMVITNSGRFSDATYHTDINCKQGETTIIEF